MTDFYTFHQSVRGHLHIMKDIPCEDNSAHYRDEEGRFYITAVADGHGDTACMRSADGSSKASEIAVECLRDFAQNALHEQAKEGYQSIKKQLENALYDKNVLKPLTDTIVSRWTNWALEELKKSPLTKEELQQAGSYADAYQKNEKLPHVYGTTLLAALLLPDYLILLQQGDGRCVVFYEDGTVQASDELGMIDERCHENVTTSLCDTDAAQALWKHSVVVPLKQKKIMACFLGCDGVEDSYRNTEGLYTFYRELMCVLGGSKQEKDFEDYLLEYLPKFSKMGSGDDISVAGIVDRNCIQTFLTFFKRQIKKYMLSEELRQLEGKKASMTRKHGILQERAVEQKERLEEKRAEYGRHSISSEEYSSVKQEFEAYDEEYQDIQKKIKEVNDQINALDSAAKEPPENPDEPQNPDILAETELSGVDGELWNKYRELEEKNQKLEAKIQELEAQKQEPKADIQKLEEEIRELKRQQEESKEQIRELVQGGTKFLKKNKPLAYGAGVLLLVLVLLALGVLLEYRSVKREYQAVKQELESYDKEYQEVQAGIEEVNLKIEALNSAAKNLSENPDELEVKIQELEVKIQELETQIQELEAQKQEAETETSETEIQETEKPESEEEIQEPEEEKSEEEKSEPETEKQKPEEQIQELKKGRTKSLKKQAVRNPYA